MRLAILLLLLVGTGCASQVHEVHQLRTLQPEDVIRVQGVASCWEARLSNQPVYILLLRDREIVDLQNEQATVPVYLHSAHPLFDANSTIDVGEDNTYAGRGAIRPLLRNETDCHRTWNLLGVHAGEVAIFTAEPIPSHPYADGVLIT